VEQEVAAEEDMTRLGDVPNKRGDSGEGEVAEEEQYGKQECSKGGRSDGGAAAEEEERRRKRMRRCGAQRVRGHGERTGGVRKK
jgi:hypothetical protein